jgi:hypothetical protein
VPLVLALVLLPVASASARPTPLFPGKTKGKPTAAPSCTVFSRAVEQLGLGSLKAPGVTTLPAHHSLCSWTGQQPGKYTFVVMVQVSPSPAFLGRRLMEGAKRSALAAEKKTGGDGAVFKGNPGHGRYFEQMVYWSEEQPNTETEQCPAEFNEGVEGLPKTAIEPGQSSPQCAGQPGLEGNFAEGYGSPRPNVEPMILQVSVASQIDELGPLPLARMVIAAFAGHF